MTSNDAPAGTTAPVDPTKPSAPPPPAPEPGESRWRTAFRQIVMGNALIGVLAVVLAMVAGSILICATNPGVQSALGYFFARPADTFVAIGDAIAGAYAAFFRGSIYNFRADDFLTGLRPLTDTLQYATPLIAGGLGVGLAFRAGLFNIGGRGQMLMAAAAAGWVGFALDLPFIVHMLVALIAGVVAGALWGAIAGALKAFTGAHEVIVTIMLNYVAFNLIQWLLSTPGLLQAPGSNTPTTPAMAENAVFPELLGPHYNLHLGFVFAIAATVLVWWILERSSIGFRFRAVGESPQAARAAGISVKSVYLWSMVMAGGLLGLAGVSQVLGTVTTGFSDGIDAAIGFDAITVALLGRSRPWGIFAAGLLFGAFKAGGYTMQSSQGVNVDLDIVTVVTSLIVLFIAAPPLVRTIFRLPQPGVRRRRVARVAKGGAA